MQLEISGHGVEVTKPLREYATEKLQKVERHFDHVTNVHVVLGVEKLQHKAEATINSTQKQIHAQAEASDMYAAIDLLSDKLDSQIRKHKEKLTDHHRAEAQILKTGT
jgi:putative sigma-54 modulation protein